MKLFFIIAALFISGSTCAEDVDMKKEVPEELISEKLTDQQIKDAYKKVVEKEVIEKAIDKVEKEKEAEIAKIKEKGATDDLAKWNLGFGLGVEQYRDDYIESASMRGDSKIVTIEQRYETRPSAWLTMNWNLWKLGTTRDPSTCTDLCNTKFGLFAGVKLIDSNASAFSSFALGPQMSFQSKTRVISVGLGWVTHRTKKFAKDISEGEPLPSQYDDIVYENGTENSYMLMMSVGI